MEMQTLLYEGTKALPKTFSKLDIHDILVAVEKEKSYQDNDWGKFIKARDKCIIKLMYLLCLRPRCCLSLKFSDFNKNDKTLFIDGRNNKQRKDRILPLTDEVYLCLEEYCRFNRIRFWQGSNYLFPSFKDKNMPLNAGTWKGRFRNILKIAGLYVPPTKPSNCPPYRSYTLRHTRATEIMNKTHDIFLLSNLLGHSKLESTKIYLHKSKHYQEYMRNALSNSL